MCNTAKLGIGPGDRLHYYTPATTFAAFQMIRFFFLLSVSIPQKKKQKKTIEKSNKKLMGEAGMAIQKSIQTRVVGIRYISRL